MPGFPLGRVPAPVGASRFRYLPEHQPVSSVLLPEGTLTSCLRLLGLSAREGSPPGRGPKGAAVAPAL
jgi:hypothetical protein